METEPIVGGELQLLQAPYFDHFQRIVALMRQRPELVLHLENASYRHFACTQCGDCCQLPWRIDVSKSYYDQWAPVLAEHPSGRFKDAFLVYPDPEPLRYAAINRQTGSYRCVFLEADNTCLIHREYGPQALSAVCTDYPRMPKSLGRHYQSRQLMNSCQAVPPLVARDPGIAYRLEEVTPPRTADPPVPGYPGRCETYLWLGLALDLLDQPQPRTQIGRWRQMLPLLEWMDGVGISAISEARLVSIRDQTFARMACWGLELPRPEARRKALGWACYFLKPYPSCASWLHQRLTDQDWPQLSLAEAELLDHYCGLYLRSRLLGLPYWDYFTGKLTPWQQLMLTGIQLLVLQALALHFRARADAPLDEAMLQRAMNVVGYRFEQKRDLSQQLQIEKLTAEECYTYTEILLSVDFAAEAGLMG